MSYLRKVKKKDYENLSSENIEKVLALLNPAKDSGSKPISKKEACAVLNIAYNTTRLQKIIEGYHEQKEYVALRKSQNRGKSASDAEIGEVVTEYLRGATSAGIAKGLYRSAGFVKAILERTGVPQRPTGEEEKKAYDYIPEECVSEEFTPGEIVWSAKHHCTAIVEREISVAYQAEMEGFDDTNYENKYSSKCYAVWVVSEYGESMDISPSKGGSSAYALAYDLARLTHLERFGVDLSRI